MGGKNQAVYSQEQGTNGRIRILGLLGARDSDRAWEIFRGLERYFGTSTYARVDCPHDCIYRLKLSQVSDCCEVEGKTDDGCRFKDCPNHPRTRELTVCAYADVVDQAIEKRGEVAHCFRIERPDIKRMIITPLPGGRFAVKPPEQLKESRA